MWTLLFAAFIIWLYAAQPKTVSEVATKASVAAGTYQVDEARFEAGRDLFRRGQYSAARDEWGRADPERRDARVQFYTAYAFYRQGWGRFHNDDEMFRRGIEAADLAMRLAPEGALRIDDPDLKIHSAAELKAEMEKGTQTTIDDLNPLRVFGERK